MQDLTHALILRLGRVLRCRMALTNCTRDNGDIELTCKGLIAGQVLFRFGAGQDKIRVLGHPRREMVFWKDSEVATGGSGFADGCFCLREVCGWVDGLKERGW